MAVTSMIFHLQTVGKLRGIMVELLVFASESLELFSLLKDKFEVAHHQTSNIFAAYVKE